MTPTSHDARGYAVPSAAGEGATIGQTDPPDPVHETDVPDPVHETDVPDAADPLDALDVVIVGGRVAGSAMAIHLARAGLRVAVVERDAMPSDTLSTHVVQDLGLFDELGVLQEILACGAPPLLATNINLDGVDLSSAHPRRPRLCLRRFALDGVLSAAADEAGALMLRQRSVVDLLRTGPRVTGVLVQGPDGSRHELRARLVVGADGRSSTVARLVGARKYDTTPNERTGYWRYYRGLPMPAEFHLARRGRDLALAAPTDQGLTLVAAQPPLDDHRDWRDPTLLERVAGELIGPLRGMLRHAEPVGDVRLVRRMDGFFREAAGPGWVLVGDAGHFKDVVVGQGICDALRQARSLSRRLAADLADRRADARAGHRAANLADRPANLADRPANLAGHRADDRTGRLAANPADHTVDDRDGHRADDRTDRRADDRTGHRADERAGHRADDRTGHRADDRTDRRADHGRLDASLRAWWRERDADARPMYWLAQDLGRVDTSVVDLEVLRVLSGSGRLRRNLQLVLEHHRSPSGVVGPAVAGQAIARAAVRTGVSGPDLRGAVAAALRRERERRSPSRRPAYGL